MIWINSWKITCNMSNIMRFFLFLISILGCLLYLISFYENEEVHEQHIDAMFKNDKRTEVPIENIDNEYQLQSVLSSVRKITNCFDRPMEHKIQMRGDYWVLYNYVRAERSHSCHETITFTTHGDFTFLDNLEPLLKRWNGPISVALHAPGTDFNETLDSIAYLRDCTDSLVKKLVTFHIFFPKLHIPKWIPKYNNVFEDTYNCSSIPPHLNFSVKDMYKTQKELLYPINVARNIARETAQTYFILASDIELQPSINIIRQFLSMISENKGALLSENPKVFPLNLFEVDSRFQVPEKKSTLLKMLRNRTAIPFHKKLCSLCHRIPKSMEWQQTVSNENELHVFHVDKRIGKFFQWEPIFIGTHSDPLYDERLSWEGMSDKMTQGYAFCVLDYDFLILDNAFLVHKPGIKTYKNDRKRNKFVWRTLKLLPHIREEMTILFGSKEGCVVR